MIRLQCSTRAGLATNARVAVASGYELAAVEARHVLESAHSRPDVDAKLAGLDLVSFVYCDFAYVLLDLRCPHGVDAKTPAVDSFGLEVRSEGLVTGAAMVLLA